MTLRRSLPGRRTAVVTVVMAALAAALWLSSGVAQAGPPDHAQGGGPPAHAQPGGPPAHAAVPAPSEPASGSGPEHAGGATVTQRFACTQLVGYDPDTEQPDPLPGETSGHVKVLTPSGNATLVCVTDEGPADGSGAQLFNFESTGVVCGILVDPENPHLIESYLLSTQWHAVVTPSGMAIMVCHFNHGDADNEDVESDSTAIDSDAIDDD